MNKMIIGAIFTVVCSGLVYAMDKRIDQRVGAAIGEFQEQEIERKINFYITKEELAPAAVTPDDRVNRQVLERQLKQIRSR